MLVVDRIPLVLVSPLLGCGCAQASPNFHLPYAGLCRCTGFPWSWSYLCWAVVVQFHSQGGINSRSSNVQFLLDYSVTRIQIVKIYKSLSSILNISPIRVPSSLMGFQACPKVFPTGPMKFPTCHMRFSTCPMKF